MLWELPPSHSAFPSRECLSRLVVSFSSLGTCDITIPGFQVSVGFHCKQPCRTISFPRSSQVSSSQVRRPMIRRLVVLSPQSESRAQPLPQTAACTGLPLADLPRWHCNFPLTRATPQQEQSRHAQLQSRDPPLHL